MNRAKINLKGNLTGEYRNTENSASGAHAESAEWGRKFAAWNSEFDQLLKKIGFFENNTEREFLSIGNNLRSYYLAAKEITGVSSSISELISEKILKTEISELNSMLSQIQKYLSNSATEILSGEASLKEISSVLLTVVDELSGFKRIIKHLRMLGISTRIESARLSQDDAGFVSLAENVENLSSKINDKAGHIREKSVNLSKVIGETITKIIYLENKQREETSLILNGINGNLSRLDSKYKMCSEKTSEVSIGSSAISQDINRIVTSIQFHDITRQQIEHVGEAIEQIKNRINSPDTSVAAENEQVELAVAVHNICRLQSMQLNHSRNEFITAVQSIIESLENVRLNVSNVLLETQEIMMNERGLGDSNIITEIENEFKEISLSLSKNSAIRIELTNSMKIVTDTVKNLSGYVDEIEEIGSEIELIALNSSIKAARTGSEGAALGVLADSIQKLSGDAKVQTKSMSELLKKISDSSEILYQNTEFNTGNRNYQELSRIASAITEEVENLTRLDKESTNHLNGLKTSFQQLDDDISRMCSGINVHNAAGEILGSLIESMDEIVCSISEKVDVSAYDKDDHLSGLDHKYTMDSERHIHKSFLSASADQDTYGISDSSAGDPAGDGLGDNVELF